MTHKQLVITLEPSACIEEDCVGGWLVRKHPGGPIIGSSAYEVQAWQSARMRLFHEGIMDIISSLPVVEKGV